MLAVAAAVGPWASPAAAQATVEPPLAAPTDAYARGALAGQVTFDGVWQAIDDRDAWLEFEPGRVREFAHGELVFRRAAFDGARVITSTWGRRETWRLQSEGEESMVLETEGPPPIVGDAHGAARPRRWRRVAQRPPVLELAPFRLGEATALPAERVGELQAELARRRDLDQEVRRSMPTTLEEFEKFESVDGDNARWLAALVGECGWIDADRFGREASSAAFLIAQHCGDLSFLVAVLPAIERDARGRGVALQNFALCFDRTQVLLGHRQRYGTQLGGPIDGTLWVIALEDRERVDELRRTLGMTPLAEYLDRFRKDAGVQAIRFEDDLGT